MNPYWTRIGLGALGVFAVGMVAVTVTRSAARQVDRVAHSAEALTVPLAFVPFRFDGERLGMLRRLRIERSAPDRVDRVELSVKLDDSVAVSRLGGCALTADDVQHLSSRTTFLCVTPADSASGGLVPFGEVVFEPTGVRHQLMLPQAVVAEFQADDAAAQAEEADAAAAEAQEAAEEAAQALGEAVAQGADLRMHADSDRATLRIRGADGRDIFTLNAGPEGVQIRATDSGGRTVLRVQADSTHADVRLPVEPPQPVAAPEP